MDWSLAIPAILVLLLALSEVLALIPAVKANSVFQLVSNVLRTIKDKLFPVKA